MKRREVREKVVQVLYQVDMRGIDISEAMKATSDEPIEQQDREYLESIVKGILNHQTELDESIKKYLRNWSLERLGFVDRAILRLAAYEIYYMDDIPDKVSVNEAIELSRSFGMEESVKYINAVLANLVKEKNGAAEEVPQGE
ncbi:transcription antitermination factor NusB [Ammoniphilus sp. CFH 90114]|uniref:transcription antitermination factor NusB n=1 Tax=Ammoniphilus sp. CFH 90114 TaxID=2493665 RepID=UPI00100E6546|nr:transcription antitermination factor NusB [Ammoniphilus sp. CFH 90114]RXT14035.1 transcription antitermination factor NusB [Ammoniphilus sp. CFH 90114]